MHLFWRGELVRVCLPVALDLTRIRRADGLDLLAQLLEHVVALKLGLQAGQQAGPIAFPLLAAAIALFVGVQRLFDSGLIGRELAPFGFGREQELVHHRLADFALQHRETFLGRLSVEELAARRLGERGIEVAVGDDCVADLGKRCRCRGRCIGGWGLTGRTGRPGASSERGTRCREQQNPPGAAAGAQVESGSIDCHGVPLACLKGRGNWRPAGQLIPREPAQDRLETRLT